MISKVMGQILIIAYHKNKFDRGFDRLINVWGGDHHGYIARMEAAIQALGYSKDKFSVKVIQMVSILEQGETLRMSKRSGRSEERRVEKERRWRRRRERDTRDV